MSIIVVGYHPKLIYSFCSNPLHSLRIRDGVGEVVGDGCLSLDVGTRALYIGLGPRDVIGVWNPICWETRSLLHDGQKADSKHR